MRMSVEHCFGLTQNLWLKNGFELSSKIGESPVACYFRVAVLLLNCYTCLRGNQVGRKFVITPPKLGQYLQ